MNRTRVCLLAALVAAVMGCDLATSTSSGGGGSDLNVVGSGEGSLPVADGVPIVSADGDFELYYSAEDYGDSACVSAWVRNTGATLTTWKISVGLDRGITSATYTGAGDNLVFLYERELVVVPASSAKLRTGDVVAIRYCAAPVALPVDVSVTPGDESAPSSAAPTVLTSDDFTLYQTVANEWDGGGCVQMALRNGGPAVTGWALRLQLDASLPSVSSQWGAIVQPAGGDVLDVLAADGSTALDKGGSVSFGYCGEPLALARTIVSLTYDTIETDDPGATWPQSPTLSYEPFTLYQSPAAQSGFDGCVQVVLRNNGPAVDHWSLRLQLEQPLTKLINTWGAVVQSAGADLLDVFPTNPELDLAEDGTLTFGFCAEPHTFLSAVTSASFTTVPTSSTEPQNTFTAGSIDDPGKGVTLRYSAPVASGEAGVGCYDVTFQNNGSYDLAVTRFVVALFADAELVNDSWHGDVQKTGTGELTFLWPVSFGATMKKGQEYKGNLCLKPVEKPYVLYVY